MLKFDDLAKVLGGVAAGVAAATLYTHLTATKSVVQSVAGIGVHPDTDDHWMALVRHSLRFINFGARMPCTWLAPPAFLCQLARDLFSRQTLHALPRLCVIPCGHAHLSSST
jgi:hypothetical protein